VTNALLSRGEVVVNGDAVLARQVANQIALRDAIQKYGASKVFTFHRDVKSAQSFVSSGPEGVGTHLVDVRSPGFSRSAPPEGGTPNFQTFHVNGMMPTARREREMRDFRAAARAVMSNARCLTEGVDVPAVDMVAFLSPRRSRVDIVQATGRAMRRSAGKTTGYCVTRLARLSWRPFEQGRELARSLGLKSSTEWWAFSKTAGRPCDWFCRLARNG
jgi:Helicase conserved C-terminal domain